MRKNMCKVKETAGWKKVMKGSGSKALCQDQPQLCSGGGHSGPTNIIKPDPHHRQSCRIQRRYALFTKNTSLQLSILFFSYIYVMILCVNLHSHALAIVCSVARPSWLISANSSRLIDFPRSSASFYIHTNIRTYARYVVMIGTYLSACIRVAVLSLLTNT